MKLFSTLVLVFAALSAVSAQEEGAVYKEGIKIVDQIIAEVEAEIAARKEAKCVQETTDHTYAMTAAEEALKSRQEKDNQIQDLKTKKAEMDQKVIDTTKQCTELTATLNANHGDWEQLEATTPIDYTGRILEVDEVIETIEGLQEKTIRETSLKAEVGAAAQEAAAALVQLSPSFVEVASQLTEDHDGAKRLASLFAQILDQLRRHKQTLLSEEAASKEARDKALTESSVSSQSLVDALAVCKSDLDSYKDKVAELVRRIEDETNNNLPVLVKNEATTKEELATATKNLETCHAQFSDANQDLGAELATLQHIKEKLQELDARDHEEGKAIQKVADKALATEPAAETATKEATTTEAAATEQATTEKATAEATTKQATTEQTTTATQF